MRAVLVVLGEATSECWWQHLGLRCRQDWRGNCKCCCFCKRNTGNAKCLWRIKIFAGNRSVAVTLKLNLTSWQSPGGRWAEIELVILRDKF